MLERRSKQQIQYQNIQEKMLQRHQNLKVSFSLFMAILNQYRIKVYCQDEMNRLGKFFSSPLEQISFQWVASFLKFHGIKKAFDTTTYLVKITGRKIPEGQSVHKLRKLVEYNHPISQCLKVFKLAMNKMYGVEVNWFPHLGGVPGSDLINKRILMGKIAQEMKNTSHYQCIFRVYSFFIEGQEFKPALCWSTIFHKLKAKVFSRKTISIPANSTSSPTKSMSSIRQSMLCAENTKKSPQRLLSRKYRLNRSNNDLSNLIQSKHYLNECQDPEIYASQEMQGKKENDLSLDQFGESTKIQHRYFRERTKTQGSAKKSQTAVTREQSRKVLDQNHIVKTPIIHSYSVLQQRIFEHAGRRQTKNISVLDKYSAIEIRQEAGCQ